MKLPEDLELSPAEARGVRKYKAYIEAKRMAARKAPFYAEIDRQFGEIEPEERERLATRMYWRQMREMALKRSQPRGE